MKYGENMKRSLCSSLIAGLFAVAAHAGAHDDNAKAPAAAVAAPSSAAAVSGVDVAAPSSAAAVSGVDVAAIDAGVRAQDDFFRYSQGKWLRDVEIPSDRASWGAFNIAQDKVEGQVRTIIEEAAAKGARKGSNAQKMGDYYASYVDQARRNELGLAPLEAELARVAALKDKRGIAALSAHFSRIDAGAPLDMGVHQDNKDSTRMIVDVSQSGLGMPNRDYYLQDDARA
jgi:putative endopeptidase